MIDSVYNICKKLVCNKGMVDGILTGNDEACIHHCNEWGSNTGHL